MDKRLYVPLPTASERTSILTAVARNSAISELVDFKLIAENDRCNGFSGADMTALLREAGLAVLRELPRVLTTGSSATSTCSNITTRSDKEEDVEGGVEGENVKKDEDVKIKPTGKLEMLPRHFEFALSKVRPSVSADDRKRYARMREKIEDERSS